MYKTLLSVLIICLSCSPKAQLQTTNTNKEITPNNNEDVFKNLPFKMDQPIVPTFLIKEYLITNYGAVSDAKSLNTTAFANAINDCNKNGGGKVVVPKGTWITAPFELKSNVNLYLEKDAIIQFTTDHTHFPIIKNGSTSTSYSTASPIYAYDAENIAITGFGTIDGAGESWRPVKKNKVSESYWKQLNQTGVLSSDGKIWWPTREALLGEEFVKNLKKEKPNAIAEDYTPARDFLRPHMIFMVGCKNILVEGVRLQNSPKFIFYPTKCTNLTIKNVNVYNNWWAQNGDGIDISASKNVYITNTTVDVGDDAICMKSSGKPKAGEECNLENIVIEKCTVLRGHGGFVIGSNTDGGMKNIFVTNCKFEGTDIGIRVKSNAGRGGKVSEIYCENITMKNIIKEAISFDTYYEDVVAGKEKGDVNTKEKDKIPEFTNFYFKNITCDGAETAFYINGLAEQPVHHIYFNNLQLNTSKGFIAKYASDIDCVGLTINASGKKYSCDNCLNMKCEF